MPHVVLSGPARAEDIWLAFNPLEVHEAGCHYKAYEAYLSHDKSTVLVRALVVEKGFPKNFFMRITQRGRELALGLEPLASPDRTDAVKRFLGLCAWQIMMVAPEMQLVNSNIKDFVRGPEEKA